MSYLSNLNEGPYERKQSFSFSAMVELPHECSEEGDLWVIKNSLFFVAVSAHSQFTSSYALHC